MGDYFSLREAGGSIESWKITDTPIGKSEVVWLGDCRFS